MGYCQFREKRIMYDIFFAIMSYDVNGAMYGFSS